jgi:Fe-S-cluster containining protein
METATHIDSRSQAFGYVCRQCTRCCRNNDIKINPYEAAKLARNLGLTTAEFRATRTRDGAGIVLKHTDTGACTFLGGEGGGCSVYQDRPLVCRVFPLGRELLVDGSERYFPSEGGAKPGGEFTREGTVGGFLEAQGVPPFAKAANEYFHWLCDVAYHLHTDVFVTSRPDLADAAMLASDLVEIDAAITSSCATGRTPEPTGIEERRQQHLALLNQKLDEYTSITKGDGRDRPDQVERAAALYRLLLAAASVLAASLGVIPGDSH